jgi:hypothetical protein
MGALERRWLILSALLVLGLGACRPADPDLELTGHEAPLQSPLATDSALNSPLDAGLTGPSPLQAPAAAGLQSPVQHPMTGTRVVGMQPTAPTTEEGAVRLVIMHTNDTWGYYNPCG